MPSPKTVIIGTVLLLGNLTVTLQARPTAVIYKDSIRKPDHRADESISFLLQQQGLEKAAAQEKAKRVFGTDAAYAAVWMHNLHAQFEGVSMDALGRAVAKRALFDKPVDLTSYDALVGLVHEIRGKKLTEGELHRLRNVAAANRLLKEQWV